MNFAATGFASKRLANSVGRLMKTLHREYRGHVEMHQRMMLGNRPWAEEYLHWARANEGWELHGHLIPPRGWRQSSVTRDGWCPGQHADQSTPPR